jgi:hypothetical protein
MSYGHIKAEFSLPRGIREPARPAVLAHRGTTARNCVSAKRRADSFDLPSAQSTRSTSASTPECLGRTGAQSCRSVSGRRRFGESLRLIRRNQSSSARQSPLVQACFDCSRACSDRASRPAGHLCRLLMPFQQARVPNIARIFARPIQASHRSHRSARALYPRRHLLVRDQGRWAEAIKWTVKRRRSMDPSNVLWIKTCRADRRKGPTPNYTRRRGMANIQ